MGENVTVDTDAFLAANVIVGDSAKAGDRVVIGAGVTIGSNGALCDDAKVHDGMTVDGGHHFCN